MLSTHQQPDTAIPMNMVEAVNQALHDAMAADEDVVVLGEDIATNGGVFRATEGLKEAFGIRRVMDTPLAENLIAGLSVGMATQGLRPVAEIQFMGFIYATLEQLISHAARMRNRTRGRLSCPLVIRAPFGGGIHAPEHHSESTEALFAQIPGLRVVIPSSPARTYGLLRAAIDCPDPVLFLEPKRIYRLQRLPVARHGDPLPLDRCFTLRAGTDVSLISWGAMIHETLAAADELKNDGISAEVIDVATLNPLDRETLIATITKTGRAVIVHEAPGHGGFGGEIAATLASDALLHLRAPVERVTGYDCPMPYFALEQQCMPGTDRIVAAAKRTLEY
ncbi:pyruvate dehydrogenase E1 component beta subunit [Tamilnaduibacter salinus]|uniref:2-oxoisovalerate dehydrogenase subunit beta n=1 Tax=Tamilnaduibacter salinus TaxID=1484056 RepID=A0A2U1D0S6_9GAMM|nr:alpha-ketoacid dehydrogenase subunit beta [Tamilnaduibacter salinus]PVY78908.1 pyruvate dehydrogenase E1 component beta subunit [Tamilnaduibacter salinus]